MMNRMLIVDDHPLYANGIAALLQVHFPDAELLQANSAAQARQLAQECGQLDWVLFDYFLPDSNGIELLKELNQTQPLAHFVLTSGNCRVELVYEALEAGAHGFLSKSGAPTDVIQCLQIIAGGGIYLDHDMNDQIKRYRSNFSQDRKRMVCQISKRQKEVLLLLSAGYSNAEIASALGISPHTVKDHVSNIMQLLDADNRVHCITEARQLGLIS